MTSRKISVYPNRWDPRNAYQADQIHDKVGLNLHNNGFSHNTAANASFTYHHDDGRVAGTISNSWYNGNVKRYQVASGFNGNPFSKSGVQRIECTQNYNHTYSTWFEIGSGSEKLWFPDVTGIGMNMGCYTYGWDYAQDPRIKGIYGGYINYAYTEHVIRYPFQAPGGIIQSGGPASYKYAELSTAACNYIRDNNFKFNKLYIHFEIARVKNSSQQPFFEFDKITFLLNPTNSNRMFVVPTRLRSNRNGSIQYI